MFSYVLSALLGTLVLSYLLYRKFAGRGKYSNHREKKNHHYTFKI